MQYPSDLPCPLIEAYQVDVETGRVAVTFEHGNTRQRKTVARNKQYFTMTMVFTLAELVEWQTWANDYGYDWHTMDLVSHFTGVLGGVTVPHTIRYISDITYDAMDSGHFRVTVQAEMDMDSPPAGAVVPSGNWIVAKTPAAPASPDWIIAKTPAAPASPAVYIAGTPNTPAA